MKDIKQAVFILMIAVAGFYLWDYYNAVTWEQQATVTFENGESLSGLLSWNSASRLSYRIVTDEGMNVIPKDDVKIIAFMHEN